jgi:sodium-coupled neutral amino acid transporter 7/8
VPQLAIGAMVLKTYSTYPILLFCGREALRNSIVDFFGWDVDSPTRDRLFKGVVVTAWFFLSVICAIVIPNISDVIRMLGSLAAVFIFILPGLGLVQYATRADPSYFLKKTWVFVVTSVAFLFLGTFIAGTVLTQSVMFLVQGGDGGKHAPPLCY